MSINCGKYKDQDGNLTEIEVYGATNLAAASSYSSLALSLRMGNDGTGAKCLWNSLPYATRDSDEPSIWILSWDLAGWVSSNSRTMTATVTGAASISVLSLSSATAGDGLAFNTLSYDYSGPTTTKSGKIYLHRQPGLGCSGELEAKELRRMCARRRAPWVRVVRHL